MDVALKVVVDHEARQLGVSQRKNSVDAVNHQRHVVKTAKGW